MADKWIYRFEELGREYNDLVGKKCANLAEMGKAGLPVPPGFAIAVAGYEIFLNRTNAGKEIQECLDKFSGGLKTLDQFKETSKSIRQIIESKRMPRDMEETIASYYDLLCQKCSGPDAAVSVRSAGAASHPGQYETYLNVRGKSDLMEKVIKVWSSTFAARALAFRSQQGLPLARDPIGVAVVKMVNAYAAGVAFTADPKSGDTSKIMLEANWGLGESVVGSSVTPDRYILGKETLEILEKTLGRKTKRVVLGNMGTVEEETPQDEVSRFCLTDDELKEIGRLSKLVEAHFGGVPQDLEWALDKDLPYPKNAILLQARPAIVSQKRSAVDKVLDLAISNLYRSQRE